MRYLVTGGGGFIGSNLVKELLSQGHRVIIIDDFSTGSKRHLELPEGLWSLREGRISDASWPVSEIDGVFHLGIPSSPYLYRDDRRYVNIAVRDWITLLDAFKISGKKIVYASTSSIYNGNYLPWDEGMQIHVKDFYSEVRYFMERLGRLYYDFYSMKSIGLRLFAVFGEGEESKGQFANVVTQMMWAKRENKPFEIWGGGNQSRDLIYVKDVVRAFIKAMESKVECDIFNVGNGIEWTFNEMAKVIGLEVEYKENPMQNYVGNTLAYLGKAQKILGFQAKYDVREQIERLTGGK